MPVRKKDKQVGVIDHRSGVSIPLMFNPNERGEDALTFNATFSDMRWKGPSANDVREQVREYLDSCSKLDWLAVIEVKETHPFASNYPLHFVGIELDRYYLAPSAEKLRDGRPILRKLRWGDYDCEADNGTTMDMTRIKDSQEYHLFHCADLNAALPMVEKHSENHIHVIRYTEEMWVALQSIQDGIGRLKTMLRGLISTDAGHQKLMAVGAQMLKLLPPVEENSTEENT